MSYTEANLADVQAAILALATGTRVVNFSMGGKTFQYAPAQLNDLKALRDEIKSEVDSAAVRPKYVLTSTEKGL